MTNSIKILITTESHEVFNVRMNRKSGLPGICSLCGRMTEMLTIDEAVSLSNLSARQILREIEPGRIHSIDTSSGHIFVCRDSLLNFCNGEKRQDENIISHSIS